MSGVNRVQILGNVGKIEVKEGKSGMKIATLSIATSKKKQDGEIETEWHNCVLFGKVAEIAERYVQKGHKLYLDGSLKTDKWVTEGGETRYSTKIIGNAIELIERKPEASGEPQKTATNATYANKDMPFDDDIPF